MAAIMPASYPPTLRKSFGNHSLRPLPGIFDGITVFAEPARWAGCAGRCRRPAPALGDACVANYREGDPLKHMRLYLFGAVQIEGDGQAIGGFESRKALALLCYLALQRQARTRAHLAELFWPDRLEERSRGNLNRVLHNLSRVVPGCVNVTRQTASIAAGSAVSIDVAEFEQLAARDDLASLSAAADLCRGELLQDFALDDCPEFDQWLQATREHWRQKAIQLLHRMIDHHFAAGTYAEGIARAHQLLALDGWQEESHRTMMRLLAANSQRNAALAQYEVCQRVLTDELGIEPEPATVQLYERIRDGVEFGDRASAHPRAPLALAPPVYRLPRPATSFVGRQREIAHIAAQLGTSDCQLLTLLGIGGIGKTRLALRAAEMLEPRFANGVAFVSLEKGQSKAYLLDAIADACTIVFVPGTEPSQQLINQLRRRQMLLLLDNGEYLGPEAQLLATLLEQAPGITILAMSRERLRLQIERVLEIEGLDVTGSLDDQSTALSNAVELFRERVEHVRSGQPLQAEELADAVRICRFVGGSPLAIELAAGWSRTLTCREIADEVARNLDFLTSSLKDVPERHRSLRVVFEHSWLLLAEDECRVCSQLAVFRGGFDRSAAERVAGATAAIMASLVDKLFIYRSTGKPYALHELVRQYTQAKLAENPAANEGALGRHFEYYAAWLAERAPALVRDGHPQDARQALDEINAEIENIRAGWSWAAGYHSAASLESFVDCLALFYNRQGWFAEEVNLLNDALRMRQGQQGAARLDRSPDLRTAQWERQIGVALYSLGRIAESQQHLYRALDLLDQPMPGTPAQWARALIGQALRQARHRLWPYGTVGRISGAARDTYMEAARVFERLTEVYYFNDQTIQTGYAALRTLNLSESYGVGPELLRAYANACMAASALPWTALADTYAQRARQVAQQVAHPSAHAYSLLCTGAANVGLGRWDAVRLALESSMAVAAECGEQRVWEEGLTNMIMVEYYQGEFARQLELCEQLQALADRRGDAQVQAWARIERSMNCLVLGPADPAPALLEEAIALVANNLGRAEAIMVHGLLALAYLRTAARSRALETAAHVAQLAANARPTTYFSLHGYASVAETYLTLWEQAGASFETYDPALRRAAARACRDLQQYARVFTVGRPYAALYSGLHCSLSGLAAQAHSTWQAGLAEAKQLGMPYLQGLLHERLARSSDLRNDIRVGHARQARALFEQIQVRPDLARVEALLEQG